MNLAVVLPPMADLGRDVIVRQVPGLETLSSYIPPAEVTLRNNTMCPGAMGTFARAFFAPTHEKGRAAGGASAGTVGGGGRSGDGGGGGDAPELAQLLQRAKDGDRRAADAVVRRMGSMIDRVARVLIRGRSELTGHFDDLRQAGRLSVVQEAIPQYDPERGRGFERHAAMIAKRRMIDELRKLTSTHHETRAPRRHVSIDALGEGAFVAPAGTPIEERELMIVLQIMVKASLVHKSLGVSLDATERDVLYHRLLAGDQEKRTLQEIADRHGLTESRISQIQTKLVQRLKESWAALLDKLHGAFARALQKMLPPEEALAYAHGAAVVPAEQFLNFYFGISVPQDAETVEGLAADLKDAHGALAAAWRISPGRGKHIESFRRALEELRPSIEAAKKGKGRRVSRRQVARAAAVHYNRGLPDKRHIRWKSLLIYVDGSNADPEILGMLKKAGVEGRNQFDETRLLSCIEKAIAEHQAKASGADDDPGVVRRVMKRARVFYNEGLTPDRQPSETLFENTAYGKTANPKVTDLFLRAGLQKKKNARIDRPRLRDAFRTAEAELRAEAVSRPETARADRRGPAIARRAHAIYTRGLPESKWPDVETVELLARLATGDPEVIAILQKAGVKQRTLVPIFYPLARRSFRQALTELGYLTPEGKKAKAPKKSARMDVVRRAHGIYLSDLSRGRPRPTESGMRHLTDPSRGDPEIVSLLKEAGIVVGAKQVA